LDFNIVSDFELRVSSLWRTFSTPVENVRQIDFFLQNKPNFPHFSTENKDYAKKQTQYKPNSNPIKPNFGPISLVAKPKQSQYLPKNQGDKPNQTQAHQILSDIFGTKIDYSLLSGQTL